MNDLAVELDNLAVSESLMCEIEDCKKLIRYPEECLTILTQNVRSMAKNFDSFVITLKRLSFNCDVLVLTECFLSKLPSVPSLHGYYPHVTKNVVNKNDGVVVYVRDTLKVAVYEPPCRDCTCLVIKIGGHTAIIGVYRSPSFKCIDNFVQSLNDILAELTSFRNISIAGDINIDIRDGEITKSHMEYLNVCSYHGLLPAHTLPTRNDKTCLDHIILKTKAPALTLILDSSVTDHQAVLLCLHIKQKRVYAHTSYTKINSEGVRMSITNINWGPVFKSEDANSAMEYFFRSIQQAIIANSITVKLSRRNRIIKSWITPGLLRCMRHRDRLHRKVHQSPQDEILKLTYTKYRNYCNNLIKKVKIAYERSLIEKAGNNNKKIWEAIGTITNTTKIKSPASGLLDMSCPEQSIEKVNEFFVSVGESLARKTSRCNNPAHLFNPKRFSTGSLQSIGMLDTDETEVNDLIANLKNVCSVGWDGIPNNVLKENRQLLVPILTHIFNICLREGKFPSVLKKSVVHPIHKSNDKDRVTNYRPISILPSISKLLERVINRRLVKYMEINNLFSHNQFGFRTGKSACDAVHELLDHVVGGISSGKKTIGIFLDLAKAFDTVSVPLLLNKLERMGIRGTQYNLLKDYLSKRCQCVKINGFTSSDLPVTYGVPQGSILGPTLFLAYINDLCGLEIAGGKIITYADDTVLLFSGHTWDEVFRDAQRGFDIVSHWLSSNILTLNADKTHYIAFSMRNSKTPLPSYSLFAHHCCNDEVCCCPTITRTNSIKYLGVIIDNILSFKYHIELVSSRLRKLIYVFKNLRHAADPKLVRQVYLALGQSILEYCITVWGGAPKTTLKPLEIAQRAVLKVCTFRPYLFPTYDLYQSCEVLTVRQLFILSTLLRQHSRIMNFDNSAAVSKLRNRLAFSNTQTFTHVYVNNYFCFLGPYLYGKINKSLNMKNLNKKVCKTTLFLYLQKLTYNETEDLLCVLR